MGYIGSTPTTQSFIAGTDYFNGTGSQTVFTLSRSVVSVNDIQATVNNVVQQPNDAYTVSGTTITFTSAPSAGTNNVYVRYLSTTTQAISPSQGTVGWAQLNADTQQDLGISFKNRIINGAMQIDQRNAGASVTIPATTVTYTLDRWAAFGSAASKFSVQQDAGAVTPPAGFTDYLGVTSLSAYTVGSSEGFWIRQPIEGFNIANLGWGTANARTVTLSFWVRSSLTGTFGGTLLDNFTPLSYPFSYTISTANTWEQKSITIVGPTSGTFPTNNTAGLYMIFGLGNGSTVSGTAGSWQSANLQNVTGATSVVGTNGATFYITGVQLEVGTQATTFTTAGGSYGAELALCQRYFQIRNLFGGGGDYACIWTGDVTSGNTYFYTEPFPVAMRTAPTGTILTSNQDQFNAPSFARVVNSGAMVAAISSGTGARKYFQFNYTVSAEL
jgi:hypothetical protein